jgi:predicted O-linked N-acetylglucosamine transferase (SPINDLY family)
LTSVLANLNYDVRSTPQQVFDEHRAWADSVAAFPQPVALHFADDRDPERPLRVGFVSPDLRRHPVSYIFAPVLAAFERKRVESFCYHNFTGKDVVTDRLMPLAAHWRDVAALSDDALLELIRADRIDILVDLAGHTIHNRLLVFARRAAPVQVSWLGYFNTTGLPTMDYFITDPHSSPPGQDCYYTEKLVRLPDTRFCYEPSEFMPDVNELPAVHNGHITFGCFNNLSKLNDDVLQLWARILHRVPQSRLVLQAAALDDAPNRMRFRLQAERAGLHSGQLELRGFMPVATAPRAYHDIDIALDPFPFCGGMTSFEALWMGVPVITLEQAMIAGRQTLALLRNIGLPELVAADKARYADIAVDLATDRLRLGTLRQSLRPRFAASPLQDYAKFTHAMEDAFRLMWLDWIRTN